MPRYDSGNLTNRPGEFAAAYRVNDGRWIERKFLNKRRKMSETVMNLQKAIVTALARGIPDAWERIVVNYEMQE
jgi:hypothetical protein